MQKITKADALKKVHDCALLYGQNLSGKSVLFVAVHDDEAVGFEAVFMPHHFMHLTGVDSVDGKISGDEFFRAAFSNKLSVNEITLKPKGITEQKLNVLPQLMNIHTAARMIGDFDNSRPLLIADKFAGTVTMAMGFINVNGLFMPRTALKLDVREITTQATRRKVAAIFVKPRRDKEYKTLTYIAKGLTVDDDTLLPTLQGKVDMQNLTAAFPIPRKPI
jgi:hypothetical protein